MQISKENIIYIKKNMQISRRKLLEYYSNPQIMRAIFTFSTDREFVSAIVDSKGNRKMGARPNFLNEEGDIYSYIARGSNEFHTSIERWCDVMNLGKNKTKEEMDNNRKNWDFIIDIDVDIGFSYAKIIASEIVLFFVDEGIPKKDISIKFSGNKGFHIGLRGEEFPDYICNFGGVLEKRAQAFPFLPLFILCYLEEKVSRQLKQKYIDNFSLENISEQLKQKYIDSSSLKPTKEFLLKPTTTNLQSKPTPLTTQTPYQKQQQTNLFVNLKLDFQVFSSRHFIRSPYSLHPKSGFVSLPILPSKIHSFKKEQATIDAVLSYSGDGLLGFLDKYSVGKASKMVSNAFLWFDKKNKEEKKQILNKIKQEETKYNKDFTIDLLKIDAEKRKKAYIEVVKQGKGLVSTQSFLFNGLINPLYFPPTILNILKGLKDGRKRALFILINFFRSLSYPQNMIEIVVEKWNLCNTSPLPKEYVHQQIFYNFKHKKPILPPSFSSEIYKEIGVYEEDELTKKVKNPITYVLNKLKYKNNSKKPKPRVSSFLSSSYIEEKDFPQTIQNIFKGVFVEPERAAEILINFFRGLGENVSSFYSQEQVELILKEWNLRNTSMVSEEVLAQKIHSNFMRKKAQLIPPLNSEIYKKMGVCGENALTKKTKNPITYVKNKIKEKIKEEKIKEEKIKEEKIKEEKIKEEKIKEEKIKEEKIKEEKIK